MKRRWKKAAAAGFALILGAMAVFPSACGTEEISAAGAEAGAPESDADEVDETVRIVLSDKGSSVSGPAGEKAEGVKVDGDKVEITAEGTYVISGSLSDGQIYVEASDEEKIILVLDGVNLTNETVPAVYVENAKKVCIELADGSDNLLQSGISMPEKVDENATGGTVFSRDDLTITGTGALTVNGYINDGIHGNDDLTIESGDIAVNAVHHAVKTNGTLSVEGGILDLTSGTDGIHSEDDLVIRGGDILIDAGDDGIHADTDLTIEDGRIEITDSYEGIEANRICVEDGDISVLSRDDGFNANGGQSFFGFGGQPAEEAEEESAETRDPELIIDGGTIYVNAGGDGIDSNGDLIVNGGYIIIDGPENSANGALDSGRENGGVCQVNGGTVLAIGASGMAERFGETSLQASFRLKFNTAEAGTEIRIEDASGEEIFTYTSVKSFSSLVFTSPEIEVGKDYVVTVGSESFSFTQSSISDANTSGGGKGGGPSGQGGGNSSTPGGGSNQTPGGSPGSGSTGL